MFANNRISKIDEDLGTYLPNLQHLILTNNHLAELGDLDGLGTLENLTTLSLLENPVSSKEYYRLYLLHRCPKLRILDFKRVKESVCFGLQQERIEAHKLFSGEAGLKLADKLSAKSKTFDPDQPIVKKTQPQMSKEEQARIRQAIKEAKTLSEIAHLEQQLSGGLMPGR